MSEKELKEEEPLLIVLTDFFYFNFILLLNFLSIFTNLQIKDLYSQVSQNNTLENSQLLIHQEY